MNDDDFLDPSYLISRLVHCFCPGDLNALSHCIDILRSFNFKQVEFDTSVFRNRWITTLESSGKYDQINIMNKSLEKIVQTINRPNSFFLLLDQLRPSFRQLEMHPENAFKSNSLPNDFIFVLQGIEGKNFKWNHRYHRFVSSEKLSPNLYSCAQKVSEVGCMVKTVLGFLGFADSLIHQYTACAVRDIYINHLNYISSIESSFPYMTPTQMLTFLSSSQIDELRAAAIICSTIDSMGASSIYNVLHTISQHGDQNIANVALRMKEKTFEGIEKMIKSWVSKGEVDDPFFEFFIQVKGDVQIYSNWWHDKYFIAQAIVPVNLSQSLIKKIFSAGKSLNFVRMCDEPVQLEIDSSLSLEQYVEIAAKEANDHILGLIMNDDIFSISLQDINSFVLLQRGDFSIEFLEKDPDQVKLMLQGLINEFSNRKIENITYDSEIQPTGGFKYNAKSPLSAIFGPNELRAYKVVSAILLRLKRSEHLLNSSIFLFRSAQILAFEVRAFISLVGDYLNVHIIYKSYENMKSIILNKDISFDELLYQHTAHVNFIARGCWATNSGQKCRMILFKMLDIIDIISLKLNNIKKSKESEKISQDVKNKFHSSLLEFHSALLTHKISGIELAPPIVRMFRNVFK